MDDGAKSSISKESHPSKNEEEDDDNQEEEKLMNYSSSGILSWPARLQLYTVSVVFLWRAITFI